MVTGGFVLKQNNDVNRYRRYRREMSDSILKQLLSSCYSYEIFLATFQFEQIIMVAIRSRVLTV